MLDFPRRSELQGLFQTFHERKAALPEINPPLQDNSSKSSTQKKNLYPSYFKVDLGELQGTTMGIVQHLSIMSTGRKYGTLKSSVLS